MLTTGTTVLAAAGVAGAASLWLAQRRHSGKRRIPHFRRIRSVLNPSQRSFHEALVRAVGPRPLIFARLNLAYLVEHPGDDPQYQAHWRRVCRRWLDFVICSPTTMSPVLAVKLETRLERKRRRLGGIDVLKDTLESARIPLLRLPLAETYDPAELMEKIRWVLVSEKQKSDSELFDTEELQELPFVVDFARKQLPTFVRWSAELRTVTAGLTRAVIRH